MTTFVFIAVLFAAACHAGWNAAIKTGLDTMTTTVLIATGSGLIGLALMPVVGLPAPAAWPYVVASAIIHLFYFAGLIESYSAGDMGQVYPIARGAAPLLTAAISTTLLAEPLHLVGWSGLVVLVAGVFLLSLRGGRGLPHLDRRAVGYALFTAATIVAYTLVDGVGARISGNAHAYTAAVFAGNAVVLLAYAIWRRGRALLAPMPAYWRSGAIGGALQLTSYGIAIWAMTVAPIALVAALRETSVLFGAVIAVFVLGEPLRPVRLVAAAMILCGLVLMRVS